MISCCPVSNNDNVDSAYTTIFQGMVQRTHISRLQLLSEFLPSGPSMTPLRSKRKIFPNHCLLVLYHNIERLIAYELLLPSHTLHHSSTFLPMSRCETTLNTYRIQACQRANNLYVQCQKSRTATPLMLSHALLVNQ